MNYKELKDFLATLTEEQLQLPAVVFKGDDEQGYEIDSLDVSDEDIYWEHHGDCLGNLETAKESLESLGEDWEDEKEDLIIVPKGTVTIHID